MWWIPSVVCQISVAEKRNSTFWLKYRSFFTTLKNYYSWRSCFSFSYLKKTTWWPNHTSSHKLIFLKQLHLHKGSEDLHNCLIVSAASQLANFNIFGERGEKKNRKRPSKPIRESAAVDFPHEEREQKWQRNQGHFPVHKKTKVSALTLMAYWNYSQGKWVEIGVNVSLLDWLPSLISAGCLKMS